MICIKGLYSPIDGPSTPRQTPPYENALKWVRHGNSSAPVRAADTSQSCDFQAERHRTAACAQDREVKSLPPVG
jgi:hypothetical protein